MYLSFRLMKFHVSSCDSGFVFEVFFFRVYERSGELGELIIEICILLFSFLKL